MQDDVQNQTDQQEAPSEESAQPHDGILNQTFGEVLQNKEAQEKIMKAMHIGPEQFQQLLKSTEGNPLTNMTVGQLFSSGFVQKAMQAQGGSGLSGVDPNAAQAIQDQQMIQEAPAQEGDQMSDEVEGSEETTLPQDFAEQTEQEERELDPEQFQEMVDSGQAQVLETDEMGNPTKIAVEQPQPQKQSFWDFFKGTVKDLIRGKS